MNLSPEQIAALNLTPDQLAVLSPQNQAIPNAGQLSPMDGASGYIAFKQGLGKVDLYVLKNGQWQIMNQTELLQLAQSLR